MKIWRYKRTKFNQKIRIGIIQGVDISPYKSEGITKYPHYKRNYIIHRKTKTRPFMRRLYKNKTRICK